MSSGGGYRIEVGLEVLPAMFDVLGLGRERGWSLSCTRVGGGDFEGEGVLRKRSSFGVSEQLWQSLRFWLTKARTWSSKSGAWISNRFQAMVRTRGEREGESEDFWFAVGNAGVGWIGFRFAMTAEISLSVWSTTW